MKELPAQPPTWHHKDVSERTTGAQLADRVAGIIGSWPFIITQTVIIAGWITLNLVAWYGHWDPFPFILLNLLFSTQAAYSAPIIMMSQNRAAERDRHQALADYHTNIEAKVEIEKLQKDLSRIENEKLDRILELLHK